MSAKRGYQDRRLVVWGLTTLAGAVVMFATLRLGGLPGIIGTLQANEVIKLILGVGRPVIGRLVTFSAMDLEF